MSTKQPPHGKDQSESPKSAEVKSDVKSDVKEEAKPAEEKPQASAVDEIPHGLMAFARRHPLAAVLGAAGIGLFGGVEIAAAMLVGAGVAAIVRGQSAPQAHVVREKAREVVARKPELKNRARAIVDAVRGRIHTNGHNA
jgi:uncharacterized protein HemX